MDSNPAFIFVAFREIVTIGTGGGNDAMRLIGFRAFSMISRVFFVLSEFSLETKPVKPP